jgi:hypothetical protein
MRDDNETLLRRLINGAAHVLSNKTDVQIRCVDCGEWKQEGDSSPCGSHLPLPDPDDDTFLVRIGFVKPKPVEKELPKPVKDGQPTFRQVNMMQKQRDERYKRPEDEDPLFQPSKPLRRRTDGGKSRADYVGLRGSNDPFTQAQERKAAAFDYEPQVGNKELVDYEDDIIFDEPHYELEQR